MPSTSSSDDALNTLPRRSQPPHQIPLFQQQSMHNFSVQGSGSPHRSQSTAPSPPKVEPGGTFLSDINSYIDSFSVDERVSNHVRGQQSFGALLKTGTSPTASSSPEALLDVISTVQRKLLQLEAAVRSMIQGRIQQGMFQQHQSLSSEFSSILSQLFVATSGFSSHFFHPPSPAALVHDAFDFSFDGFNEEDMETALGGSFCPSSSRCSASIDPTGSGSGCAEFRIPSGIMDPRLKEIGQTGLIDPRLKEVGQTTTSTAAAVTSSAVPKDAVNVPSPIRTNSNIVESHLVKGTPSGPLETGNSHGAHDVDAQLLMTLDDHREDDDDGEGELLPPGSYELVELAATEILAEHTHFCEICSKGFKRDANLRMHMRGHGDEYKTPAALARPDKTPRDPSMVKLRRYSCPYAGCKRNRKHQKFLPLKTMLCVKNHYRRSHCPKLLMCSRCKTKKFSVVADLKTHEKHCGQDKWQCSCGTTFSRKDKLFGHIGLFVGHTPATPIHELDGIGAGTETTLAGLCTGFGEGIESLVSNKGDTLGTGGVSTIVIQDNAMSSFAGVSHGMDVSAPLGMVTKPHKIESSNEQSLAHREKNVSYLNAPGGVLIRDAAYSLAAATYEGAELRNLLSDSYFNQVDNLK